MNEFVFRYPTKVYFGEKAAEKNLCAELSNVEILLCLPMAAVLLKRMEFFQR